MVDSQKINALLHGRPVVQHYTAKTGDFLQIELPRMPLTRYTEYVRLAKETRGDTNCFAEVAPPDHGEGLLLPRQILGRAICPGEFHIILRAVDSLSGQAIPDVKPLDIVVNVRRD